MAPGDEHRAEPAAAGIHEVAGGGDPACWAHRVCPECGRLNEAEAPTVCERCGASLPAPC
jgi:rubrerythrin